ncbi:helix-turn-helix domain-containing protein [Azospirillum isscasi]|uniref:Helix-turn-helix transcriptional regulator n=1 Tax=Azospirillum isscasi TaxID=3053926 RepID=A0ABU0WD95_9PROT|nr:helix-turn-helix transcriptional regulator [Azospirillum isscasi]MDQ2102155.1 helix-turn-helix transcriptional regulator [Azospirillum isscasi]
MLTYSTLVCDDSSQVKEGDSMHVSERLRLLRERAGMSKTELAKALGYKYLGGYHFENPDRKANFLPVPTVVRLISIMKPRGIGAEEILELAGFPSDILKDEGELPPNILEDSYVRTTVTALAEFLQEEKLEMAPKAQGDIVVKFCSVYQSEVRHGRQGPDLDTERVKSILRFWTVGR